jgi:pyruvate/2-oxoglutarate/acetoin dehydrogenase E1 component
MPEVNQTTFRDAIIEALVEEMDRDPSVIMLGEDIGKAGGVFKQTQGLFERFGDKRVIDTPISEPGAFGMAVGAAMAGSRPVFEVMFGDFITLIMDQLVNQAAKVSYMSAGKVSVPLVVRVTMGTGSNLGPQHSQSLYAWACHVPGLKVLVPATVQDAKSLYKAAIRDPNPVLIFEDRMLYGLKGACSSAETNAEIGRGQVLREGSDVTILAVGRMVQHAIKAAEDLQRDGISAEIIDPRSLVPFDTALAVNSVRKTNRALVVDGGVRGFGAGAELAAIISDEAFDWLDAPVRRLCGADIPIPISRTLEPLAQPNPGTIASAARALVQYQI